jgi:RNA polymerase sigma factor (TIGR02999 family)
MTHTPDLDPSPTRPLSAEELFPLVYEHLRGLAGDQLARELPGHTLTPTALVHEAYLRLAHRVGGWCGRTHFLHAAARAMRNILISHARAKKSLKRGGDRRRIDLDGLDMAAPPGDDDVAALDEALTALAAEDPLAAAMVELRYFGGADWPEVAAALNISADDARREWCYARAWLVHRLRLGGEPRARPGAI